MMEVQRCPTCQGEGRRGAFRCSACKGDGRLAPFGQTSLSWGRGLTPLAIAEHRLEEGIRRIVAFLLMLLGVGGIAALGVETFRRPGADLFDASFWLAPSPRLFLFYLTLWTDAYLYSRLAREAERTVPVPRRRYGEAEPATGGASFEALAAATRADLSRSYATPALRAVERAVELARTGRVGEVREEHLLAALLAEDEVAFLFARLAIPRERVLERVKTLLAAAPPALAEHAAPSDGFWNALFDAYLIAYQVHAAAVRPVHLFLAIARAKGRVQELLFDLGTDEKKLEHVAMWVRTQTDVRERSRHERAAAASRPRGGMNRSMTAIATPALDTLSEDLTARAAYGALAPFVDREKELAALYRILEGGGRSVLVVGLPGTGKGAFLEGLASRMAADDVPAALQDMRLVSLSISKLIAGASPADAAERLERVFYEVAVSGNIILAIPGIEGLIGVSAAGGGGIDLSQIVATNLEKLRILAIATTTPEGYGAAVERSAIGTSFEKLEFPEASQDDAIEICEAMSAAIEGQNRVFFTYDAIEKAVTLSDRYLHDRFLPEKAIETLRETAYAVRASRGEGALIGGDDVAALLSEKAKVPLTTVTESESEKLLGLEERMRGRVIGQEEAVSAVARAIRRARTDLRADNRPIANFLFLGPTGVGKTELAKTVAATYFGNEEVMIRLDMSEYQEQSSIGRLLGVPGGSAGGVLTEAIRKQPFALLLLDEIEKAHPDILNVFLQVMDDGRITDNVGRTVDCTNVILIATSNAGSQFIQDALRGGKTIESVKDALVNEQLKGIFRPEFLNRFDGVVVFRPLSPADVEQIARLMLIGLAKQLEAKQIAFQATDEAVAELAAAGFDPVFGARPLRRAIQERVQDALASEMLKGSIGRRDTVILEKGGGLKVVKH